MIVDPAQLWLFIPAALALNLTPGADMMFCIGQGARHGPGAGVAAACGIAVGGLVHVALAAAGLAAFLAANPAMFEAVRWGGVLYLLWLAFGALRGPAATPEGVRIGPRGGLLGGPRGGLRAFREAIMVSVLNPKVAVFILALLPQFVDPSRGSPGVQFAVLGLIFSVGGLTVNGLIGAFAGGARRKLAGGAGAPRIARVLRWGTALLFTGLAARLAFDRG
jgi:threonine/homoserine/homoserine lactone efflux protein